MERIGSKKLAKFILNWHRDIGCYWWDDGIDSEIEDSAPGWTFLGAGMYRTAYLGPDGYVYKVDSFRWTKNSGPEYNWIFGENAGEWQNYKKLASVAETKTRVRFAKSYFWSFGERGVMCQELVDVSNPWTGHTYPDYVCMCDQNPYYTGECFEDLADQASSRLDIGDFHSGNVYPQEDGTLMACDFAGG